MIKIELDQTDFEPDVVNALQSVLDMLPTQSIVVTTTETLDYSTPAYNFADLRSGLEDIRDQKGDWRGTVDWLLTTLPDADPIILDCQSCQ